MQAITIWLSDAELEALHNLKNAIGSRLHPTRSPKSHDGVIRWCLQQKAHDFDLPPWPAPPNPAEVAVAQAGKFLKLRHITAPATTRRNFPEQQEPDVAGSLPAVPDLDEMTVAELREFAGDRDIDLAGARLKAEIIDAINAAI